MKKIILSSLGFVSLLSFFSCEKSEDGKFGIIPIKTFSDITLGNDLHPTYNSFIELTTGETFGLSRAPTGKNNIGRVDLVYYYNTVNHGDPFLASPNSINQYTNIFLNNPNGINYWSSKKVTYIDRSSTTYADFDNINNFESLKAAYKEDPGIKDVYNVKSQLVYKFKTGEHKIGLIRVKNVTGNGQSAATMTIDIKVQE